jgi:hypothetical protein
VVLVARNRYAYESRCTIELAGVSSKLLKLLAFLRGRVSALVLRWWLDDFCLALVLRLWLGFGQFLS